MSVRDRLIQLTLRARNFLSKDIEPASESMRELAAEGRQLRSALKELERTEKFIRMLRDNREASAGLESAWRDAKTTLDALTREVGDSEKATAGQTIALVQARRTMEDAERAYKKNQRAIKNLSSDLQKMGVDTENLTSEEQRLSAEVVDNKKALDTNRAALQSKRVEEKKAADTAKEHADRVGVARGAMEDAGRKVLAFAAAYVSLNAAMGLVQRGLSLVAQGIRAVATSGSDEQQALAQLEATLASTGRQAEFTTAQLQAMADELEDGSMRTAEEIQSAQARLLSYTDVAAKEFPRAMQIVVDQQQRLGISIEQSAETVGRALQSPSEAIATLGRQGFKFEADQKRLLKQLEATGRKAEAQAMIMDMLTEAYGGAAAAAKMGTFAGLLKTIDKQVGDFTKRVMNSGAFEFMQRKLLDVSNYLDDMAKDGRLDRLAEGLSKGFIQGVEWAERFAKKLLDIDFQKVTDDAAAWAGNLGQHLDDIQQKFNAFVLPFRALFNGLTAGLSLVGAFATDLASKLLIPLELVAKTLPDALGGDRLRSAVGSARATLNGLTAGFVAQVEQDGKDIQSAWDAAMGGVAETGKGKMAELTESVKAGADEQFEHIVQRVTSINNALNQISSASTVAELRKIGAEMYAAYQRGDISQQEYAAGSVELNRRLTELGGGAKNLANSVGIAADSLKSLADVQRAISDAKTDRDITAIRTAIKRLYDEGNIGATEYNDALAKVSTRQKELAQAVQGSKKAQDEKNDADRDAIRTSEDLRRESGRRMEAERKASGEAMERRRKESSDVKRDMSAMEGFFGGVIGRAREGAAALSQAALEAFDRLRGISTAAPSIDTSGLDATRDSLERVTKALGDVRADLARPMQSTLARWMAETQQASLQTQQAFLSQKAGLQDLMRDYERGSITTQQFVRRANSMKHALSLLDDSDLSGLESAIDAANQRMQQMGQSTRSTLESLQDELDGLQGRQDDIERRRFAARQRELQAQLAEAQAGGDAQAVANANRALGLLRQIEAESAQARQAEEQKKRMEAQQATQPAAQQAVQTPSKVIRLEIPGRPGVDVSVSGDAAETNLLSILEQAGLRSL